MSIPNDFAYRPARWPVVVGVLAITLGLAMLAAAAWGFKYAARIASDGAAQTVPLPSAAVAAAESASIVAPPLAMHVSDMRALFKLAAEKRLALGSVEYQAESNRAAGVLVKHVILRIDDEYPKLKSFVAELLKAMPHAQLEELQIEQAAGPQPALKIQSVLKLSLVYRADDTGPAPNRVAAGS